MTSSAEPDRVPTGDVQTVDATSGVNALGADEVAVVVVEGEIDASSVGEVQDEIMRVLRDRTDIVIDVAGVTFMDSTGLRMLIEVSRASGRSVVLRNAPRCVRRIVELGGVGSLVVFE